MNTPRSSRWFLGMMCMLLLCLSGCGVGNAQYPEVPCTEPRDFSNQKIQQDLFVDLDGDPSTPYMVGPAEYVVSRVGQNLYDFSREMYVSIARESELPGVVSKLILLYMTLYGLMVALGMTQIQMGDAITRGLKLSILAMLFSPQGVDIFYGLAGKFFLQGVDEVLTLVTDRIGTVGDMIQSQSSNALVCAGLDTSAPTSGDEGTAAMFGSVFRPIDMALGKLLSFPAIRFYLACVVAIPNGLFFLIVLMIGLMVLILGICTALWVYMLSLCARALLLALGPIFIALMLFKQTWMYFDAWLKQLINFSLKPLLNFAFLGLFVVLVNTSVNQMFFGNNDETRIYVCYTNFAILGVTDPETPGGRSIQRTFLGVDIDHIFWGWQFACPGQCTCESAAAGTDSGNTGACQPRPLLMGIFGLGGYNGGCPEMRDKMFPIDIADALVFCALCWLACQFQPQLNKMANELSMVFMWLEGPPKAGGSMFDIGGLITGSARSGEGLNKENLGKAANALKAGGRVISGAAHDINAVARNIPIIGRGVKGAESAAGNMAAGASQAAKKAAHDLAETKPGKLAGAIGKLGFRAAKFGVNTAKSADKTLSETPILRGLYSRAKDIPNMGIGNIPGMGFFGIKGNTNLDAKYSKEAAARRAEFDEIQRQRGLSGDALNQDSINQIANDMKAQKAAEAARRKAAGLPPEDDDD